MIFLFTYTIRESLLDMEKYIYIYIYILSMSYNSCDLIYLRRVLQLVNWLQTQQDWDSSRTHTSRRACEGNFYIGLMEVGGLLYLWTVSWAAVSGQIPRSWFGHRHSSLSASFMWIQSARCPHTLATMISQCTAPSDCESEEYHPSFRCLSQVFCHSNQGSNKFSEFYFLYAFFTN